MRKPRKTCIRCGAKKNEGFLCKSCSDRLNRVEYLVTDDGNVITKKDIGGDK